MFAMFSRILKLSGRYKGRIQGAFVCAFLESILSKMPIVLAFVVLSRFAADTLTSQTCLYIGLGLAAAVLVQMLVHYLSDSLQSAAGYLMFADKRMELGSHLRKLPMGYFTSGNIGKISSVLSTDMVFIEEVAMSTLGNMMGYLLSSLILLVFMFLFERTAWFDCCRRHGSGMAGVKRNEQGFPAGSRRAAGAERTTDRCGAILCGGHWRHQELQPAGRKIRRID